MQRTSIRWKNTGGPLKIRGKPTIQAGETFKAKPDDIPQAFRDAIIPIDPLPGDEPVQSVTEYEAVSKGGGWYDVVNMTTKKIINTSSLRKEKAEELVGQLQSGQAGVE